MESTLNGFEDDPLLGEGMKLCLTDYKREEVMKLPLEDFHLLLKKLLRKKGLLDDSSFIIFILKYHPFELVFGETSRSPSGTENVLWDDIRAIKVQATKIETEIIKGYFHKLAAAILEKEKIESNNANQNDRRRNLKRIIRSLFDLKRIDAKKNKLESEITRKMKIIVKFLQDSIEHVFPNSFKKSDTIESKLGSESRILKPDLSVFYNKAWKSFWLGEVKRPDVSNLLSLFERKKGFFLFAKTEDNIDVQKFNKRSEKGKRDVMGQAVSYVLGSGCPWATITDASGYIFVKVVSLERSEDGNYSNLQMEYYHTKANADFLKEWGYLPPLMVLFTIFASALDGGHDTEELFEKSKWSRDEIHEGDDIETELL